MNAELHRRAETMLRYAEDAYGNRGLVYGRCAEHDWRGRKRNVNQTYGTPFEVRSRSRTPWRMAHLLKKHTDVREPVDSSTD